MRKVIFRAMIGFGGSFTFAISLPDMFLLSGAAGVLVGLWVGDALSEYLNEKSWRRWEESRK